MAYVRYNEDGSIKDYGSLPYEGADKTNRTVIVAWWDGKLYFTDDPKSKPPKDLEEIRVKELLKRAVQAHLDTFARTREYDDANSCISYSLTSTVQKFIDEGKYMAKMRDEVWMVGYKIMDEVLNGKRSIPEVEEVISELPELRWPDEDKPQ